jgi:hypothetical protein
MGSVVTSATLNARTRGQHSITLPSLTALDAGPLDYGELSDAVSKAANQ